MPNQPSQIIRCRVDTDTYEDIASGTRSFTVVDATSDIQLDDFFRFVEQTEKGEPARDIYRKVSVIVEEGDILIVGFVPIEYGALTGLLACGAFVASYAIQKLEGEIEILGTSSCIPMLTAPLVDPNQVNDHLGVAKWPDAQYSVTLRCLASEVEGGHQDVEIVETLILARTLDDEETDRLVTVDHSFLLLGSLKDEFGNGIKPYFGEVDYYDIEQLTDSQQAEVDRITQAEEQGDV